MNNNLHLTLATLVFLSFCPESKTAPANDMFANRVVVSGSNIVVYGSNVGATREVGEPYHAGVAGGASIWWSWTAPRSEIATISTSGSSFDTVLGVYTGTSVSALTSIASNDDDVDLTSKVMFSTLANQTYQIAVDGYGGASGSVQLNISLTPPQPAPAWHLPDLSGAMVYSSSFAGKVVVLDFWATWCNPCKEELPDLVALQQQYRADGLAIIGADVSWSGETASTVRNFVATWTPPINYQIVMSDAATEAPFGGIDAIPTTFIIDRQNFIRMKYVGTQTRSTLEHQIIPLLYGNTVLACQRSGNQMRLCWPTNALAFTLESAATIENPVWSTWPTAPTVVGGTNVVQVAPTNATRLFRLRMPIPN